MLYLLRLLNRVSPRLVSLLLFPGDAVEAFSRVFFGSAK